MACNYPFILIRDVPCVHALPVPCGKCAACRKDRVQMWQDRIEFESLTARKSSTFLTLTYNDEHLPKDRSVHLSHVQAFNKRFRYYLEKTYGDSYEENKVRYFCSSEYGDERYRPHYHFAITNCNCYDEKDFKAIYDAWHDANGEEIGILTADGLLPARIRYVVSYINYETPAQHKVYRALGLKDTFHVMSKGIGADWIKEHAEEIRASNGYWSNGVLRPLPRYYQEKLGMITVNEYVTRLNDMWSGYNDILIKCGFGKVDPFNVKDMKKRGFFDQASPESKRKVGSVLIGNEPRELALCHKQLLREQKRSLIA